MTGAAAWSPAAVCSRALNAIEADGFSDFADGTAQAAFAATHYDPARRYVLTAAPWDFATGYARADAAIDAVAPADTPHVVTLEPDTLLFRSICDQNAAYVARPFGDRLLRTDVTPPFVYSYTQDVTELYRWHAGALETLTLYLAHLFAPRFSRSQNRADILLQRFTAMLDEAAAREAQQGSPVDHRLGGARESWTALSQRGAGYDSARGMP